MQIERYWDVDFRHPTTLSYEAAADEIDARVRESVAAILCRMASRCSRRPVKPTKPHMVHSLSLYRRNHRILTYIFVYCTTDEEKRKVDGENM